MSKKSIVKTDSTKPVKKMKTEERIEYLRKNLRLSNDTATEIKNVAEIIEKYANVPIGKKHDAERDEIELELKDKMDVIVPIMALENHHISERIVGDLYGPMVVQFAKDLTKEYATKNPSEKALVEIIASSFGRYMESAYVFQLSKKEKHLTHEKNAYYKSYSLEADRAFRQFQSALAMLKHMKSPPLKVNVKAETAFVAQNQQVNTDTTNPPKQADYEINESK